MNHNLSSSLDRADELLNDLKNEYNRSLTEKQVSLALSILPMKYALSHALVSTRSPVVIGNTIYPRN